MGLVYQTLACEGSTMTRGRDFEIIEYLFCFDGIATFMKAYFDESGKHGAAELITIVGLSMSQKTCKQLQRRWLSEANKVPKIPLPFHMSDCVCGSKRFGHLRDDEPTRWDMQRRLIKTFRGLDMQAHVAVIVKSEHEKYREELRSDPKYRNPWFMAFEGAITEVMLGTAEGGKAHAIQLVFDQQDEFKERAFEMYNQTLASTVSYRGRLNGLSFVSKDKIAALQAVDIICYEVNRGVENDLKGLPQRWQHDLIRDLVPVNGRKYDKDGFALLIEELRRIPLR